MGEIRERLDDIERGICNGNLNAMQVFTMMSRMLRALSAEPAKPVAWRYTNGTRWTYTENASGLYDDGWKQVQALGVLPSTDPRPSEQTCSDKTCKFYLQAKDEECSCTFRPERRVTQRRVRVSSSMRRKEFMAGDPLRTGAGRRKPTERAVDCEYCLHPVSNPCVHPNCPYAVTARPQDEGCPMHDGRPCTYPHCDCAAPQEAAPKDEGAEACDRILAAQRRAWKIADDLAAPQAPREAQADPLDIYHVSEMPFDTHERSIAKQLWDLTREAYTHEYTGIKSLAMADFKSFVHPRQLIRMFEVIRALQIRSASPAPEGGVSVPRKSLVRLMMLIDPSPAVVNGSMYVFNNPMAAEILTKVSAEIRAMLAAATPEPREPQKEIK